MIINLNARVRVKLTPAGIARIALRDDVCLPADIMARRGEWECQLWELMSAIGAHVYNGAKPPIAMNDIEVLEDQPLEGLVKAKKVAT